MTNLGKFVFACLIVGLFGLGLYVVAHRPNLPSPNAAIAPASPDGAAPAASPDASADPAIADLQKDLTDALPRPGALPPAAPYQIKNNTLEVELAEWVGYAGIIAYNGGLDPNPNSPFTKKFGYLLKLTLNEDEDWSHLVSGQLAGSSTTADVIAAYGKQLDVVVPAQMDFSRGADAIVVRSDIARLNDLRGKIVSCCQFTESDYLLRDLAQEAGIPVNVLANLSVAPDPNAINVVVTDEGLKAGDVFLKDLKNGYNKLAGCVTWSPKTEEVMEAAGPKARILTTNRNLLIVADVLILNRPFTLANPKAAQALTTAVIEGNRLVDSDQATYGPIVEKAFKWDKGRFPEEYAKVHLSNLPENIAFFNGTIDSAGSFPGIYNSAVLSYGADIVSGDTPADYFIDNDFLKALDATGDYKDQRIVLGPIKVGAGGQSLEQNPLLSKNIRFHFEPNSAQLDPNADENAKNFADIQNLLKLSPGSTILLRGHVDDGQIEIFRQRGGDEFVQEMALKAMQLSQDRATAVRDALIQKGVDPARLTAVGRGWLEPLEKADPNDSDATKQEKGEKNRRVEAVWVTIE